MPKRQLCDNHKIKAGIHQRFHFSQANTLNIIMSLGHNTNKQNHFTLSHCFLNLHKVFVYILKIKKHTEGGLNLGT